MTPEPFGILWRESPESGHWYWRTNKGDRSYPASAEFLTIYRMTDYDDPTLPHGPQLFRDWIDFVERVARPMVEASDEADQVAERTALDLFRRVSPYYICTCMVMMANRIDDPSV